MRTATMLTMPVVLAIYLLRLNGVAGLMVDDAWYMLFAKALAEGEGYRVISSATTSILPLYPPGFPAILSFVFRISPQFPQNVWLLKSVSIAAMCGVGLLSYFYLQRHRNLPRDLASCAAVAITVTPAFVFLATSTVMSDCVFTLAQLATVVLLHRSVDTGDSSRARVSAACAGVMAAATVLIRSAGIGLVVAAGLWLMKERLGNRAAVFAAVVLLSLMPWMLYARAHAPTPDERAAHGGAVAYAYTDQLWMRWAGSPAFGYVRSRDLPARLGTNLVDVFGRDIGGILVPVVLRGPAESGEEIVGLGGTLGLSAGSMGNAPGTMLISLLCSGIALLGYVRKVRERLTVAEILVPTSLVITLLWPFWSFRFVLPLTPFLFLYLVGGIQMLARGSSSVLRVVMLCVIGLHVYDHAGYILLSKQSGGSRRIQWLADADNVHQAIAWIGTGLDEHGILASTNPALVYLRIGRKGISLDDPRAVFSTLKRRGVRYAASFVATDLPALSRGEFAVLYSSSARLWVIKVE